MSLRALPPRGRLSARDIHSRPGGVGRKPSAEGAAVSDDLRLSSDPFVAGRRKAALLTLGSMASFGVVAAYQFGLIKTVPEPPLPFLDADRVDASSEAYALGQTPDAAAGLLSAAATLVLLGMGRKDRARRAPALVLLTAGKVAADALGGLYLAGEQASRHRRFCSWCLAAAAANLAAVPVVFPEVKAALRELRRG